VKHSEETALQWAVIDGRVQHVSTFAAIAPRDRPEAFCPICERPVTMKLGQIRVHHVAHQPNISCPATQPETAVHLNSKFHIAEQLNSSRQIIVTTDCSSGFWCDNTKDQIWIEDWDRVEVEVMIGSRRPDITLFRHNDPVAAIEVKVTHAVDDEKAQYLKELGVPWIEIEGSEALFSGETTWTADKPLPFCSLHPKLSPWMCKACSERAARLQSNEYREHSRRDRGYKVITQYGIIVDYFYPSGKYYRQAYWINEISRHGRPLFCSLEDERKNRIAKRDRPLTKDVLEDLKEACRVDVRNGKPKKTIYATPTGWRRLNGNKLNLRDFDRYPRKYQWDDEEKQWCAVQHTRAKTVDLSSSPTIAWGSRYPMTPIRLSNAENSPALTLELIYQPLTLTSDLFGTCSVCGRVTRRWVSYNGKTKSCLCVDCAYEERS